jgi:hypothetical protein
MDYDRSKAGAEPGNSKSIRDFSFLIRRTGYNPVFSGRFRTVSSNNSIPAKKEQVYKDKGNR